MPMSDGPWIAGNLAESQQVANGDLMQNMGSLLWNDDPRLRVGGEWHSGELRTVTTSLGKAAFVGHCLGSDETLQMGVERAIATDDHESLTHFGGNYATFVLLPDSTSVLADLSGRQPLYHTSQDGQTLVSTKSGMLADVIGSQVDTLSIAARFACFNVPELVGERSYWSGVNQLLAGHRLYVGKGGTSVGVYDALIPYPKATFIDTTSALRPALDNAVRGRALQEGPITADCSGGHDSSAVALRAAQYVSNRLPATVFYNKDLPAGDLEYAQRLAALRDNIDLHAVDTTGILPYQNLDQLPFTDEPDPGALMPGGRDAARFAAVRELGGRLHLTGGLGDQVLCASSDYLADLVREGKYAKLLSDSIALGRLNTVSPLAIIHKARRLAKTDIGTDMENLAAYIAGTSSGTMPVWWSINGFALQWLTPTMRAQLADLARENARQVRLPEGMSVGDYSTLAMLRDGARTYHRAQERARKYGIDLHTPFGDHEVIRACFTASAWKRTDPGTFKRLLREAFSGLVPDEVFARQTKGAYDTELYRGLRQAMPQLKELLHDSLLADMGILNPVQVLDTLDRLATRPFSHMALKRMIATELWLRNLDPSQLPSSQAIPTKHVAKPTVPQQELREKMTALLPTAYVVSPDVHAIAAQDGSVALFDKDKREYFGMTPKAGFFLQALNKNNGDATATLKLLRHIYADIDPAQIHHDLTAFVQHGTDEGWLTSALQGYSIPIPKEPPVVPNELRVAWDEQKVKVNELAWAAGAFMVANTLKRLPFYWTTGILNGLQSKWATRDATESEAAQAVTATYALVRRYPGRVACLEESLTSALMLLARKKRVAWFVGAAFDPVRLHAWIAAGDTPIGTNGSHQSFTSVGDRSLKKHQ
jgi:asparagine synthase (glutamine-hydrolysing)